MVSLSPLAKKISILSIWLVIFVVSSCASSGDQKEVIFTFILQEDNLEDYEIDDLLDAEENQKSAAKKKKEEEDLMLSEEELAEDLSEEDFAFIEESTLEDNNAAGAVTLGATEIVSPSMDKNSKQGKCKIFSAVAYGSVETTRWHLKHCDINAKSPKTGDTPLILAVKRQRVDQVLLLLKKGADKNIKNRYGFTALDIAKELKNKSLIRLLKK